MTSSLRTCLREPIPEISEAAHLLESAVQAHLAGRKELAHGLIRSADLPAIRDWTESLWVATARMCNIARLRMRRQWLLAFFDFAVANRKIQKSPMDKSLVKAMRRPQVIRNAPTPQQFEAILTEVRAQPFTDHADDSADVLGVHGPGRRRPRASSGSASTSRTRPSSCSGLNTDLIPDSPLCQTATAA